MSDNSRRKDTFAKKYFFLIIGVTVIFWAFAFPFIKIGLEELSPVNLTILRLLIVCIVFLIILTIKPKKFSKLQKRDILPIFLLGFLGVSSLYLGRRQKKNKLKNQQKKLRNRAGKLKKKKNYQKKKKS